jgi:predicted DCC family thiol-disulfide oxidoreductase YuxK
MLEDTLRGKSIVFYDGDCGFCSSMVQFVLARDKHEQYYFAPLQGQFAEDTLRQYHKDPNELNTSYVLAHYLTERQELLDKSRAGLYVLGSFGGLWLATKALQVLPQRLADRAYDFIASNRHALVKQSCLLPDTAQRKRFIMK